MNILTGKVVTAESIGETSLAGDTNGAGSGSAPDAGSGTSAAWTQPDTDAADTETEEPSEFGTANGTSNAETQQNEADATDDIWNVEG